MARWGTHHSSNPHPSNRAASSGCPQPAPPCPSQLTLHPRPVAFIPSGPARSAPPPHTALAPGLSPQPCNPAPVPARPRLPPHRAARIRQRLLPVQAAAGPFFISFFFFFPPPVGNIAFNYDNKSKETSGARIITSEEARCNRRCRYPARGGRDAATPPPDATRSAPGRATCAPPLSDWPRPQTRETTPTRRCDPAPSLLAPPPSGCDHAPPALLAEGAVGGSGARGEGGLRCGWERKGAGLPCCPVPFRQGGGVLLLGRQV